MATQTKIIMTDDIDGTEGEGIETIQFGIDGANYEIDLSAENHQRLVEALNPFIEKARKRPSTNRGGRSRKSAGTNADRAAEIQKIRQWASENGIEVNERGRIPVDVERQYQEAQGKKK